ncbi:MAG TPA: hypothetical protein VGS19_18075 [Streptosporangiaceae bacterium]|nr:hypothetical protein [Streptosporangiaceae bacterium]
MGLVRAVPARWRFVLTGTVLTAAGVMLRNNAGSVVYFPGVLFLLYALVAPDSPPATRNQRAKLAHELAACSTPAQRRDLESTLDRYPDGITHELRDILASQAIAAYDNRFPVAGRY